MITFLGYCNYVESNILTFQVDQTLKGFTSLMNNWNINTLFDIKYSGLVGIMQIFMIVAQSKIKQKPICHEDCILLNKRYQWKIIVEHF